MRNNEVPKGVDEEPTKLETKNVSECMVEDKRGRRRIQLLSSIKEDKSYTNKNERAKSGLTEKA